MKTLTCLLALIALVSGTCGRNYDVTNGFDKCGKCVAPKYMDSCNNQTQCNGVGTKLYCYSKTACDTVKTEGQPCASKSFCADGLVCSGSVCVKLPSMVGDTCVESECEIGLRCNFTTNKCATAAAPLAQGGDCKGSSSYCGANLFCDIGVTPNACAKIAYGDENAVCDDFGLQCKAGFTCTYVADGGSMRTCTKAPAPNPICK